MPFCGSCGAPVEGKFCAKCGAVVGAGAPAGAPPSSGLGMAPPPAGAAAPMADNVACALCYVLGLITGIVFLVLAPYSQNKAVRFHAFQSIFLNLAVIVIDIVLGIVMSIMFRIVGFFMLGLLWPLFGLACLALWIYMILSAYQGKTVVLPVIGPLARQQA
jgi:uncharacterized membrane protein